MVPWYQWYLGPLGTMAPMAYRGTMITLLVCRHESTVLMHPWYHGYHFYRAHGPRYHGGVTHGSTAGHWVPWYPDGRLEAMGLRIRMGDDHGAVGIRPTVGRTG